MSILPFLSKYLPIGIALKGLSKVNPKVRDFIVDSTTLGYGGDQILEYLRGQLGSPDEEKERLESGDPNLRPDELASLEKTKQREAPGKAIQKGLSLATGLAGGLSGLGAEESENEELMVPQNVPISEGEKPIARGMQPNIPAVKQAGEKLATMRVAQKSFSQQQQPEAQPGVMEGISQQLKEFVEGRLSKGHPLAKIASLAKSHFFDEIKAIEDESGTPFSQFLESLYGKGRQQARVKGLAQQEKSPAVNDFFKRMQQLEQLSRQ